MARIRRGGRTALALGSALSVGASLVLLGGGAQAAPGHTVVASAVPAVSTPDVQNNAVNAIYDAGSKIIAGGPFSTVQNHGSDVNITRGFIFAFDKTTGVVDSAFAPIVNGDVRKIIAGPSVGTVYIAGSFSTVNGVTRRKVALLNVADGSVVSTFKPPAFDGVVNDIALVGSRLLVGGAFTHAGTTNPRGGLASINASTGTVDSYLTVNLTGHHNYDGTCCSKAAVGVENMAVSPDGTRAVVIGNFKMADAVVHDQVVKLSLGSTAATIADWNTDRYTAACNFKSFDTYVRDVAYSPDGSYFVIVTTGARFLNTLCDSSSRWEDSATGSGQQPTWVDYTGGDTYLSVGISEQAVYVGGHFRWMNNSAGSDNAKPGAVARPGVAALDPVTGLPLAWNPGRNPRGKGAEEIAVTADGVWVGSDTDWIGNFKYKRQRIAFFPTAGGVVPHSTATASLPGTVYLATSSGNTLNARSYDGAGTIGADSAVANPDATAWSSIHGAFWVGGTLYYGQGSTLVQRSFDGTNLSTASNVDPYHDPLWDTVVTGSGPAGQTYVGSASSYYTELPNVTGAFYTAGRLYYTLSTSSGLFWRWFNPDSGAVGADRFTVAGATGFGASGGIFLSGGKLYLVNRNTGTLSTLNWVNGAPDGTATVVDVTRDWRNAGIFVGP